MQVRQRDLAQLFVGEILTPALLKSARSIAPLFDQRRDDLKRFGPTERAALFDLPIMSAAFSMRSGEPDLIFRTHRVGNVFFVIRSASGGLAVKVRVSNRDVPAVEVLEEVRRRVERVDLRDEPHRRSYLKKPERRSSRRNDAS